MYSSLTVYISDFRSSKTVSQCESYYLSYLYHVLIILEDRAPKDASSTREGASTARGCGGDGVGLLGIAVGSWAAGNSQFLRRSR